MTLRISDLQSDSDLDSIRNSCDVFIEIRFFDIQYTFYLIVKGLENAFFMPF